MRHHRANEQNEHGRLRGRQIARNKTPRITRARHVLRSCSGLRVVNARDDARVLSLHRGLT
jgi:hypothetical protein